MKTFNLVFKSIEELKVFLEKNIKNEKNVLLQIFCSYHEIFIIEKIIKLVKEYNQNIAIIGSTTDGEIFENKFLSHRIVLSFSIFDKTSLNVSYVKVDDSYKAGAELAKKALSKDTKAVIIFADGLNTNLEDFLEGFESVNNSVILAGGLSGDNAQFYRTFQIIDDKIESNLAVAVSLNGSELIVNNGYNFGWKGIGKDFTITKSHKNIVEEVDNKPILEVFREYLGEEIVKALPKIGIEIPFIFEKNNKLMARAVINKIDNKLVFAGNLERGTKVRFAMPSIEKNEMDLKNNIQFLEKVPTETIFIYSCMARRRTEPKMVERELRNFANVSNTSGFFTYGEIFSQKTENGYKYFAFNETTTFLILSEGGNFINKKPEIILDEENEDYLAKEALINFINKTTEELYKMNKELEKKVKEAVEENIRKNLLLQHQSKQAQMGEMVSMIAHQWRQPLNVISLLASDIELDIQMGEIDKESILDAVKNIKKQTQKMSEIIDSFADFIKPDVKKVRFLLRDVIQKSMDIMYAQLKARGIEFILEYADETIEIEGYITLLEQVIINIVSNARDEFERTKQNKKIIKITCKKENNKAIIKIEDNVKGGIPENIRDKIFNPYFTTKGTKGTGLGLYMAKQIIEDKFNGKIYFKTGENGTTFIIELPLS